MRGSIDKAGRVVIPKEVRDRLGLVEGPVDLVVDGLGVRIEPLAGDDLVERDGRLFIPASGEAVDDDFVIALRDADRR